MPTRLASVVIDAHDLRAQATFWSAALGWPVTFEADDEFVVEDEALGFALVFVPVPEPKEVKNRIHVDLGSTSATHQAEQVERLLGLGATQADVGQTAADDWVVLQDPEGNELCVLGQRDRYDGRAPAAIVVDCAAAPAIGRFWAAALGWQLAVDEPDWAELRPHDARMPLLGFLNVPEPRTVKNRIHLDVAPQAGEDHAAAVARLEVLGATRADVGQGPDVTWVVLADPEGHELCVLSPR